MARHVKKGDTVEVIAGKYKGQQGKIIAFDGDKDRVTVEGVGVIKRHLKPGRSPKHPNGGIVEASPTIHVSNVLPLDPSGGKPTRVGFKILEDGTKIRIARGSGEALAEN